MKGKGRMWIGDTEIKGMGSWSFGDIPEQDQEKQFGAKESVTFTGKFVPDEVKDTVRKSTGVRAVIEPGDIDMSELRVGGVAVLDLGDGVEIDMVVTGRNSDGSVNVIIMGDN